MRLTDPTSMGSPAGVGAENRASAALRRCAGGRPVSDPGHGQVGAEPSALSCESLTLQGILDAALQRVQGRPVAVDAHPEHPRRVAVGKDSDIAELQREGIVLTDNRRNRLDDRRHPVRLDVTQELERQVDAPGSHQADSSKICPPKLLDQAAEGCSDLRR